MKNANRMMTLIGLFLVIAVPSFAQRGFTIPRMPTIPRTPSVPRSAPPAQTPRSTPASAPQSRPQITQPHPQPSQPAAFQPAAREQGPSRKEVQQQQKTQARQQKEQQKQNQQRQKEQARQLKAQKDQQQKQQKEAARQQKELQKQQKAKKASSSAKESKPQPLSRPATKDSAAPATGGSQTGLQKLNSNRSSLSGINGKPLPAGDLTVHPNGRMTLTAEGGRQFGLRSNGTVASYSDPGKTVSFNGRGEVRSIHTASMDIHRGAYGQRTVISHRADGSKVVSTGRHSGYVERRVVMNNRTYFQRTTVIGQRVYTRTFVADGFGGVRFVPPVFFAPGFYGWAYYPWAAPIHFAWGWFGAPWYMGPNPYFAASPIYPSAAFWLTDYMIGETLATAYQLHHDAAADLMADAEDESPEDASTMANATDEEASNVLRADATTPITTELKSAIAEQVRQELANDNAESRNPRQASFDMLPAALSTPNHIFVVASDLDVTTADQQLCTLQAGDMLQLMSPAASDSSFVQLRVASSKRMDCPAGVLVTVSVPDLQEMQNAFQSQVEAGLDVLHHDQGRDGLPSAPPAALAAPPQPTVSGLEPVSGPESATLLNQQREEADQAQARAELGNF